MRKNIRRCMYRRHLDGLKDIAVKALNVLGKYGKLFGVKALRLINLVSKAVRDYFAVDTVASAAGILVLLKRDLEDGNRALNRLEQFLAVRALSNAINENHSSTLVEAAIGTLKSVIKLFIADIVRRLSRKAIEKLS